MYMESELKSGSQDITSLIMCVWQFVQTKIPDIGIEIDSKIGGEEDTNLKMHALFLNTNDLDETLPMNGEAKYEMKEYLEDKCLLFHSYTRSGARVQREVIGPFMLLLV